MIITKTRIEGNATLLCYMSRTGCLENFGDSWKTQAWSLASFDSSFDSPLTVKSRRNDPSVKGQRITL